MMQAYSIFSNTEHKQAHSNLTTVRPAGVFSERRETGTDFSKYLSHQRLCATQNELLIDLNKTRHMRFCLNRNCDFDALCINPRNTAKLLGITKGLKFKNTNQNLKANVFGAPILSRIRQGFICIRLYRSLPRQLIASQHKCTSPQEEDTRLLQNTLRHPRSPSHNKLTPSSCKQTVETKTNHKHLITCLLFAIAY